MASKKRDKTKTVTENTKSITLTDLSTFAGEMGDKIEKLLGEKDLPIEAQPMALLRRSAARCTTDLMEKLGLEEVSLPKFSNNLLILGPVPLDLIHSLASLGLLTAREQILVSHDRWKEIQQVFPDLRGLLLDSEDSTNTDTHTETLTETEAISEEASQKDQSKKWEEVEEEHSLELDKESPPSQGEPKNTGKREPTAVLSRQATGVKESKRKTSKRVSISTFFPLHVGLSGLLILVLGSSLFVFVKKRHDEKILESGKSGMLEVRSQLRKRQIGNLPEDLKPLATETLYQNEFGLLKRLRPLLLQYEKGSLFLAEGDEQFLRTISQPASSSFQARILASNQLALYYVFRGKFSEAQNLLNGILLASPTDLNTLINASIYGIVTGQLNQARKYALSAQSLCRALDCWLPYALLGYVEGLSNNPAQSERLFQIALSHMDNGLIYGLWLKTLSSSPAEVRMKIPSVLKQALWADPDLLKDSPLRAPLFIHWLYTESAEGYITALASFENEIGKNKAQYLRWVNNRHPFNAAPEPITQIEKKLSIESDLLGQVLYSYLLKETGEWDQASQVLNRVIPQLTAKDYHGTMPWVLAGNLASERGLLDQSIIFFQAAQSRKPRDVNAIYGLAMNLIEKRDFQAAQEKIAETLRLDPSYIPAMLRISRLEWHRRIESE